MNLTTDQQEVMTDLINYINFKKIEIVTNEDLDCAFRDYLENGSVAHWYLQKADDLQKKQFRKQIEKQNNLTQLETQAD